MFPAPKSNGLVKKQAYTVQGLQFQEGPLVYAVCTLLLCLTGLSLGSVLCSVSPCLKWSFWTLARVW